jgi:hypothetical protein
MPYNVAIQDVDGLLYNLDYTVVTDGNFLVVTFNTPSQDLQIEYYDSAIVKNGSIRSFDYSWPGDFAVNSLSIQIQQPLGASQFSIDPVMGSPRQGLDGLNYYSSVEGTVKAGQTFTIHISYKNPNNVLSSSMQPVQPVKPINNSTSGRVTFQELLPWALGLLGVLLISGGAWWYLRVSNEIKTNPQKQNKKVDGSKPLKEMDPSANIFCQQCGRKASPGDQYCRTCGTRLHTE